MVFHCFGILFNALILFPHSFGFGEAKWYDLHNLSEQTTGRADNPRFQLYASGTEVNGLT